MTALLGKGAFESATRTAPSACVESAIAIVGVGCRFPGGVQGPDDYLEFLRRGTSACGDIPPQRWDRKNFWSAQTEPGKMLAQRASLLDDVESFDPSFFSISPREAARMDPQHRIGLEVAWEALDDAGEVREELHGSKLGVFVGLMNNDFGRTLLSEGFEGADQYYFTGNAYSFLAGRIAYHLGTRGPTMAVDTEVDPVVRTTGWGLEERFYWIRLRRLFVVYIVSDVN